MNGNTFSETRDLHTYKKPYQLVIIINEKHVLVLPDEDDPIDYEGHNMKPEKRPE